MLKLESAELTSSLEKTSSDAHGWSRLLVITRGQSSRNIVVSYLKYMDHLIGRRMIPSLNLDGISTNRNSCNVSVFGYHKNGGQISESV